MTIQGLIPACLLLLGTITGETTAIPAASPSPASKKQVHFTTDIEPILRDHCYSCHAGTMQSGGLRLDQRKAALAGGVSGPVIQPANSGGSRLIHLVSGTTPSLRMPLNGESLTSQQVGLLRDWIDQGAHWPEAATLDPSGSDSPGQAGIHWAFLPVVRPPVPQVENTSWVKNPIDAYVLAKLEAQDIEPSAEAEPTTLIRRLSLDLIGLPPSPFDINRFLDDRHSDAYERLVDRLLDSDHYGEKWARHWLDLARYADSDGYETDGTRPHAWRYRQWVIEAFNRNLPFDQFTIEQLAGDLIPSPTIEQKVATGFNRNTLTNREGGMDLEMLRIERVMDRTDTLGAVWLGLTLGCASCHDHKYDPISQPDYYQLFAFFNSAVEVNIEAPLAGEMGPYLQGKPEYDRKRRELLAQYKVADLQREWEKKTLEAATNPNVGDDWILAWEILAVDFDGGQDILRLAPSRRTWKQRDRMTDHFLKWYGIVAGEERVKELKFKELRNELKSLLEEYPALSEAQTMTEDLNPPKSHLLIRGNYRQPGPEVHPDTPAVLPPLPTGPEPPRLRLARWLVSPENPLVARVTVNRLWQELFGTGLVKTSENFGLRGDRPSHPELLDWLASEFVAKRWDIKKMLKLMVESATYRQSSRVRESLQARDPKNQLLARQQRLRLPAELIRDSALAVSGLLDPAIGGRSIYPPQPPSVGELAYEDQWNESHGRDRYRRGLYIYFKRTGPYPQLAAFDSPDSLTACSRRERSTTPLQALNLLNDPVFVEAAQALATRILREEADCTEGQIDHAFRLCLARSPTVSEKHRLIEFYRHSTRALEQNPDQVDALFPPQGVEGIDRNQAAIWVGISSTLLNLDEFITRE